MDRTFGGSLPSYWRLVALIATLAASVALLLLGQYVAAACLPLIAALLRAIAWRDAQARALARQIDSDSCDEKLEVPTGAWGDLCRAVNRVIQERRTQQRLQRLLSTPAPEGAIRALLDGTPSSDAPRIVTVLLVQHTARGKVAVDAWQGLSEVLRDQVRQRDALIQLCGGSIMLVFGAFPGPHDRAPIGAAVQAAEELWDAWARRTGQVIGGLTLTLASGPALVTLLPGLGFSFSGAPVHQALQIARLAPRVSSCRVLCDESTYYALRQAERSNWLPTEMCVQADNGWPQTVYGRAA